MRSVFRCLLNWLFLTLVIWVVVVYPIHVIAVVAVLWFIGKLRSL